MAKATPRRQPGLDTAEGLMDYLHLGWEWLKLYSTWVVAGVVVIAVGVGAWAIYSRMQASRNEQAAAALAQITPKVELHVPDATAASDLKKFIGQYPGTPAAREAQLMQANLLYKLKQYREAATAYKSLQDSSDPTWNALITDSLSYCYEGLGKYRQAAEALKPVVEKIHGPLKTEIIQRLAMLYDRAKDPKEAAVYWRKLLEKPPDATMEAYIQGRLAADEAAAQK